MVLAERHLARATIILPKNAAQEEKHAAQELRHFLREVSGAAFPLADCSKLIDGTKILLGTAVSVNPKIKKTGVKINYAALVDEGYIIKTKGECVIITANKPRGMMYGVYGFLEDYIGIRFYTKNYTYIPKREKLTITNEIDDKQIPALEYRDPFYGQNFDPDWHVRNKSNTTMSDLEIMHGGKMKYVGFVHTFNSLVPVDKYFDAHPEYYSMVDGERVRERTQLCLTNKKMLAVAIASVRKLLKDNPDANIISVSQNDWINPCDCPQCAEIDESEGSRAGSLLFFVNKIAEDIEKDYPHVIIDTLAYQYTRKAPKNIKPRKNVAVRLCSIECCFAHPLSECGVLASFGQRDWARAGFADDLREWAKICDRLHIWDYVTNFANYLSPFPNFNVLKENINFFIENHVTGIFEEGNTAGHAAVELNHLRQYVIAKLLWNPSLDVDRIVNEFISIYFGGAAQAIREYFDLIHAQITPDTHLGIYDLPTREYYPESMIKQADILFDRAEMLANDDEILHRVKLCRLSIDYLKMAKMEFGTQERNAAIDAIIDTAAYYGVEQIREGRPLEVWREMLKDNPLKPVNN